MQIRREDEQRAVFHPHHDLIGVSGSEFRDRWSDDAGLAARVVEVDAVGAGPGAAASIGSGTSARSWIFQASVGKSETTSEFSIHECLADIAMEPTAHVCDLPGVHRVKVSDSAVFRVPHVLFQQRSAPSICNCKTAETVWRYEAERAELTRDFHWHWRRIPFRIRSGPGLAQP